MSDELLAKLEVKSQSLNGGGGRGGVPAQTGVDVAAALAFGPDKFASAMYQIVQGGSLHNWPRCEELIAIRQFGEWRERAERMVDAQLAEAMAKRTGHGMQHAKLLMDGARAAMWPHLGNEAKWRAVRVAVVGELRLPRICPACNGTTVRRVKIESVDKIISCVDCHGMGSVPWTDRHRAAGMRIAVSSYVTIWRKVYEWTYRDISDAVARGRTDFNAAIGE